MVDPNDLNVDDLEDKKIWLWVEQYMDEAHEEDWTELLIAIRNLGYHTGYKHGKEDVEQGVYGKREDFPS
jgi:hypothetical protein